MSIQLWILSIRISRPDFTIFLTFGGFYSPPLLRRVIPPSVDLKTQLPSIDVGSRRRTSEGEVYVFPAVTPQKVAENVLHKNLITHRPVPILIGQS